MRLIDPGLGEVSDRLSILTLKVLFGEQAGKDVAHFKKERAVLLTRVRSTTPNGMWFEAYSELAAVNAALWHAEDDLRAHRYLPAGVPSTMGAEQALAVAVLAFRIQEWNDRRAALVAQINRESGDGTGEEKL